MTMMKRFAACCGLALVSACSAAPPPVQGSVQAPGRTAVANPALLVRDGASVAMTFTSGPGSTRQGRRGQGLFTNTYRAATNTFGPAQVLSHTPTTLTFRTQTTTCTLAPEGVVTCEDGSRGAWNAV